MWAKDSNVFKIRINSVLVNCESFNYLNMNWTGGHLNKFRRRKMTRKDFEKLKIEENIKRRQQEKCLKAKDKQSIYSRPVIVKGIFNQAIIRSKYFELHDNLISKPVELIENNNNDCQDENEHPNKGNDEQIVIPFKEFAEIYPEDEINPDENRIVFEPNDSENDDNI
ncbi:uncharacterized protein LOC113793416 isoform X2 [Dermatophagoides pteronyssinus]|uniref:uncharacterized protein LOC113793416 isoform X2 n=1 Tax=Dermatophagoides pteronyssinus TaxID=6956 RepID=UPI003F663371